MLVMELHPFSYSLSLIFQPLLKQLLEAVAIFLFYNPVLFRLNSSLNSCEKNACKFLAPYSTVCPLSEFNGGSTLPHLVHILQHLFCSLCRTTFFPKLRQDRVTSGNLESSPAFGRHSVAACSYFELCSWKQKPRDGWGRTKRNRAKTIVYQSRPKFNGAQTI